MKHQRSVVKLMALLLAVSLIFGNMYTASAEDAVNEQTAAEGISAEESEDDILADTSVTADDAAEEDQNDTELLEVPEEEPAADPEAPAEEPDDAADDETQPSAQQDQPDQADPADEQEDPAAQDTAETDQDTDPDNTDTEQDTDDGFVILPEETEGDTIEKNDAGPVVSGSFKDSSKKVYTVTVTGPELTGSDYYQVQVFSSAYTDTKTAELINTGEETWSADITVSELPGPGNYEADVYLVSDSTSTFVDGVEFTVPAASAGSISISSLNKTTGTAVINLKDVVSESGITSVQAEVWSRSSKSNLYTYTLKKDSSGKWKVKMDLANHKKSIGVYQIRAYVIDGNGFKTEVASTTVNFKGTTGKISITTNASEGKYTVKVTGFTSSFAVSGMSATCWSSTKGKDDLCTHDLKVSSDGRKYSYTAHIKNFNNFGKINVQLYLKKADGTSVLFGKTSFTLTAPSADSVTAAVSQEKGTFSLKVKNFTNYFAVTSVKAEVWHKSDQSDKKTYTMKASGSNYWVKKALLSDFASYAGDYQVVVTAYTKKGPTAQIASTTMTVEASAGSISATDKYKTTPGQQETVYKVKLTGYEGENGVKEVKFQVWPEADTGLKKTYKAKADEKGIYVALVPITDFKKAGRYRTIAYVTDKNGTTTKLEQKKIMKVDGTVTGTVSKSNPAPTAGRFTISLKKATAPSGIESVSFNIWTKKDKSDLYTYTAKAYDDGSWRIRADVKRHMYNVGKFNIQPVVVMGNGITQTMDTVTKTFNASNLAFVMKPETGKRVLGIDNPSGDNIRIAVWSAKNDQDDLKWFDAKKSGSQWKRTIDLSEYVNTGTYIAHFYSGDTFLAEKTFKVSKGEAGRNGWYYENGLKFYYIAGVKQTDLTGMVSGPYQICVNRQCNTITIYALDGANGYIIPVIAFACSTGLPGMETPTGVYYTYAKNRWEELMGPTWGQYSARVVDGIYIHSVPTNIPNSHHGIAWSEYNKLGEAASHGCIRVNVRDAKWIYDHCAVGTQVKIYDSSDPGPFGKPKTVKMTPDMDWDPTDPEMQ